MEPTSDNLDRHCCLWQLEWRQTRTVLRILMLRTQTEIVDGDTCIFDAVKHELCTNNGSKSHLVLPERFQNF
jgi:hypothetical protein